MLCRIARHWYSCRNLIYLLSSRFDVNSDSFFTPAVHSRIVQFILDRQRFSLDEHNEFAFGIERLISENAYRAAYPLHDVGKNSVKFNLFTLFSLFKDVTNMRIFYFIFGLQGDISTPGSMRHILYHEWASVRKCFRYQPLDYVKEYFGIKIALYFAWLGFYTHMLIPASVVGLGCFIYSCLTMFQNKPR